MGVETGPSSPDQSNSLQEFYVCKEHMSVIVQTSMGQLVCFDEGHLITSQDQIQPAIGKMVDLDWSDFEIPI